MTHHQRIHGLARRATCAGARVRTPYLGRALALLTLGLLLTACGEPPVKPAGTSEGGAAQTSGQPAQGPMTEAVHIETTTTAFKEAPADRSALPSDAPKGAMVRGEIEPGIPGGTLIIPITSEPSTFNKVMEQNVGDQFVNGLMFPGLYDYDWYAQKDMPGIAYAWEYNAERREWTFHLREGLKWSDGQPLTSDDFMFFTQLAFDPNIPSDDDLGLRLEPKPDSPPYEFSAPDPLTLVVRIPGVDSFAFLNLGNLRAMPRHALEAAWKDGKFASTWGIDVNPNELVVGGPFKLREVRQGERVVLERNPHYYRYDAKGQRLPYLETLVLKVVSEPQAQLVQFLAGDLDIYEAVPPQNLAPIQDAVAQGKPIKLFPLGPSLNSNYYYFNLHPGGTFEKAPGERDKWEPTQSRDEQPPAGLADYKPYVDPVKRAWFNNPEFRIACSEATNREVMINTVLFGEGKPLYNVIPSANKQWYNPNAPAYPYNPESAKARLEKLGLIDRDGDDIREDAQGNRVRFTILTNREGETREKIAQQLQKDLQAVGMQTQVQTVNFNDLVSRLKFKFDYESCLMGAGSGVPPHPSMSANMWLTSGQMHVWYPEQKVPASDWEAELESMYVKMKQTFDVAEQVRIFHEMQDLLNRQQPLINLFSGNAYLAAKNSIGNLKPTIIRSSATHNLDELFIKK